MLMEQNVQKRGERKDERRYLRLKMRRAAPTATSTQEPSGCTEMRAGAMLLGWGLSAMAATSVGYEW